MSVLEGAISDQRPTPADRVPPVASGLAADRAAFLAAVVAAAEATKLLEHQVAHDYWLVRALHSVTSVLPVSGEVSAPGRKPSSPARRLGRWGFGGGTSLTAAWQVSERYSEDVDGCLFADEHLSRSAFASAHRRISNAMCEAVEAAEHETLGRNVRTTTIGLEGFPAYLRAETTLEGPDDDLVTAQEVNSLIATHSGVDLTDEYPEVGGFRLPCVRPEWTAANKFDALHRRAVKGDLDGVSARGRDLYDLWALARSQHADAIRERTPHLWERAAGGMRDAVPRPSHGYSHSPAFVPGTEANAALETGFGHAVALTVWGDAPDFEQALQAARSLDT